MFLLWWIKIIYRKVHRISSITSLNIPSYIPCPKASYREIELEPGEIYGIRRHEIDQVILRQLIPVHEPHLVHTVSDIQISNSQLELLVDTEFLSAWEFDQHSGLEFVSIGVVGPGDDQVSDTYRVREHGHPFAGRVGHLEKIPNAGSVWWLETYHIYTDYQSFICDQAHKPIFRIFCES